ncbi:MAG: ATP-binding protein, partial [Bacteroidales bacterium]|nr:ATP-binding protein [Bacteroidales bacterium]
MKRITQITLSNYRAFYNEKDNENKYQINLPQGENLLVYGENGSGKSSLFKALEDFFLSANSQFPIEYNVFTEGIPDLPETSVKLKFDDGKEFEFSRLNSTAYNDAFFGNTTSAFLTYKDILNTYFLDLHRQNHNPNLFNLFINVLLKYLTDASGSKHIIDELEELRTQVKTFNKAYLDAIRGVTDKDERKDILNSLRENLVQKAKTINITLTSLLLPILKKVNRYLIEYFNFKLEVRVKNRDKYLNLSFKSSSPILYETLNFSLKLHGVELKDKAYQSFLNEARLSALAITVYMSALKIESVRLANQNIKFLFLDDIFIGLDTSNRIPLLQILNTDFKEFQIFITTYDRNWFEIAKRWFTNSSLGFKSIELYPSDFKQNTLTFETPVIIDPSLPYFERAKLYYAKKDYPAAANYLRKACESEIKRILPQNLLLIEKHETGELKEIQELGKLFVNFKIYAQLNYLDLTPFSQFDTYKKIVYNSLSHDDLMAVHYKKEIEDGFRLVESFQNIKSKLILVTTNPSLKVSLWKNGDATKALFHYEIKLMENLFYLQQGILNPVFSNSLCELSTPTPENKKVTFNEALKTILTEQGYSYPNDLQ